MFTKNPFTGRLSQAPGVQIPMWEVEGKKAWFVTIFTQPAIGTGVIYSIHDAYSSPPTTADHTHCIDSEKKLSVNGGSSKAGSTLRELVSCGREEMDVSGS
ncbi:hypothetical protein E2C01_015305 [Portunus trituberculatus]|uniref:Uncharacterized protein n=1 Tax=Portunus trituberculatus TaxID=210409 RepID=A0A5B7DMM1_PORTR|nr:hypothetical protein [Portunus trituberculatus]